jgi:hypothetical protein
MKRNTVFCEFYIQSVALKTKYLTKEYTFKSATRKLQNIGEVICDFQTQLLNRVYV